MSKTHTPTQHSNVVGGSSAARVIACPASVKRMQTMPPQAESAYAAEGTALHNAVEHCLYEGLSPDEARDTMAGKEFYGVTLTQKQVDEALVPAIEMFDAYYSKLEAEDGEVTTYAIETQVKFPGIDDAFGTADLIMCTPLRSVVWDWKFGAGVIVTAQDNKQMLYYAAGAAHSAQTFFFPEHMRDVGVDLGWPVDLVIAQPRISTDPSVWETDMNELVEFSVTLVKSVDEALHEDKPRCVPGEHCRWATCTPICPKYEAAIDKLDALQQIANGDAPESSVEEAELIDAEPFYDNPDMAVITPDVTALWLVQADMAEEWAKSVRSLAMDEAQKGRPPTGKKLVQKTGNLAYIVEDDKVDKMLGNKGLTAKDRRKVVPITPTQANKLLKALDKKVLTDKQASRLVTGVKMVDVDAPGEAITPLADVVANASDVTKELEDLQQ